MLSGVKSRLAAAEVASKPIQHSERDEVTAQRQAEGHFVATLRELGQIKDEQIKIRLRVDDTFKQARRELGVVLILDKTINVFVVKNWKGNYRPGPDGKFWLKRTEWDESITVEQIKSPLVELQEQITLLHNHLAKNGASVTKVQIGGKLVLPNSEIVLDDEVRSNEHILAGAEQINSYVRNLQQTWSEYLLSPVTPSYFSGALSYSQLAASKTGLGRAGGWDKLKLVGGRVIDGDYKGCSSLAVDRSTVSQLDFRHNRNLVMGKIYAVAGYTPQVNIDLLKRGGGAGWITGTELHSSVAVPYNTEIQFHFANEQKEATIPANEIESIVLSSK